MAINVIKTSHISPLVDFCSENSLILPFSFFDLRWLSYHPTQQVIFYKPSDSSRESFYSVILPKLEKSLSVVLGYYLPLAGHLKWNPQDPKPCILVLPNDTVSLIVAETSDDDADFSGISGKGLRPRNELLPLVPELPVIDDSPALLALQVTLYPKKGFSIGIASHHAFMDGLTAQLFIKSWAHICKHGAMDLPKDLTPFLDRTAINVPASLEAKMLEFLPYISVDKDNVRSMKLPLTKETDSDYFRVTFELTAENVQKLKERAKNESSRSNLEELHLSTFVVLNAYIWTCLVKARGGDVERHVAIDYGADFRNRLCPSIPKTYSGACIVVISCLGYKAKTLLGEDGFVKAVETLSDSVKGLESKGLEVLFDLSVDRIKNIEKGTEVWGIAGSNRFSVYGSDFGWGRPVNNEIFYINYFQNVSMSESRDEIGGVEISLCLKKNEMDVFIPLFKNGFEN